MPSTKFPNFMALICSIINYVNSSIHGVADQQGWRDSSEQDDVFDIVSGLDEEAILAGSSRNTFLTKREC
jgi:hypothetical protein